MYYRHSELKKNINIQSLIIHVLDNYTSRPHFLSIYSDKIEFLFKIIEE